MRTAIWTCTGRGEARSAALEHRPSAEDVPGADMSGAGASPRRDGSAADRRPECQGGDGARRVKGCMDCAPKGKGETANAQIAESTGVKAGRAQPCGPAPPPLASRHLIPAAHGQAVGRPAGRREYGAAAGLPRSRRRAGAARMECTLSAARDTHPAQDMHGSKADDRATEAKRRVSRGVGTAGTRQVQPGATSLGAALP